MPLLSAVIAISPLALDMYMPAMPELARQLNTEMAQVQTSLSIYLLGYGIGLVIFGPLCDLFSRRLLVLIGLLGFAISSVLLANTSSIETFIGLRFCQALISAAATVVVPGVIRDIYQQKAAKGMSYVSMIMMLAPMLAPTIGSLFLLTFNWQAIFYFLGLYAFIVAFLCLYFFPEHRRLSNPESLTNQGAQERNQKKESDGLVSNIVNNYRIVLGHQGARLNLICSMLVSVAFFAYLTSASYVFMTVYQASEYQFSLLFAGGGVAALLAHFTNSRLVVRKGSRKMLYAGLVLALFSSTLLLLVNFFTPDLTLTVLFLLPLLASYSIIAVNSDALVLIEFAKQSGTATAVIGTLRFGLGGLAGPILAYFSNGSALPFAIMMFVCVLFIGIAQIKAYRLEKARANS
jgi:DHA1 family bicyclomycin/chloramphenicol resistance-like MFS transporter